MNDDQNYLYQEMLKAFEDFDADKKNLDALHKIVHFAQELRHDLMNEQKAYFISINQIGPDDDFTELYTRLGFCTEAQANKACRNLSDENGCGLNKYLKLTKEEYDEYIKISRLTVSCYKLKDVRYLSESNQLVNKTIEALQKEIEEKRKRLGLVYRWQVISQRYYQHDEEDDNYEYDD